MTTRRDFMKTGGALVVGFTPAIPVFGQQTVDWRPRSLDLRQVDTWLAIHADNTATSISVSLNSAKARRRPCCEVAAEELDLDMSQLKTVQLNTNITPIKVERTPARRSIEGRRRFARRQRKRGLRCSNWHRRDWERRWTA
jgi:hypothetical protein